MMGAVCGDVIGSVYEFAKRKGKDFEFFNPATKTTDDSFGNGAAMRVSPAAWIHDTLEATLSTAEKYTAVTHNHPEGIRGANAIAAAIFKARKGSTTSEIRKFI